MAAARDPLRLLFVSTPVGPIGSGAGGGVELTLQNMARELSRRGYDVHVIAPEGSQVDGLRLTTVAGAPQPYAQYQGRDTPIVLSGRGVLEEMWRRVAGLQYECDLILNFAYDWLPLYLTRFLRTPAAHLVSMGSLSDAMDAALDAVIRCYPHRIAVHTRAQAETFPGGDHMRVVGNGIDLARYPFNGDPGQRLCWVGRIAPEKGLEDAVAAAAATGFPLDVCGTMQDERYWMGVLREFPDASVRYRGFLPTAEMAAVMGESRALIMTPKWIEALGNVAMEAMACGTPVIAYRRGGPAEMVDAGRTGWLVEPDDVRGLIAAVGRIDALNRSACREQAEKRFSLAALGDRLEAWFGAILAEVPDRVLC